MSVSKEDLSQKIIQITEQYWAKNNAPILLSKLGPEIKSDGFDLKTMISPLSLSQFIEFSCGEKIKIVRHPRQSAKIGIIPVSVDLPDVAENFDAFFDSNSQGLPEIVYQAPVWAGFVKFKHTNIKRYLDLNKNQVNTLEQTEPITSSDIFEIDSSDILENYDNSPAMKSAVHKKIQNWCDRNDIEISRLSTNALYSGRTKDTSLLENIFSSLTKEEMSRINIPLDIIQKLNKN